MTSGGPCPLPIQEASGAIRGNPNHVGIVNPISDRSVKRKLASRWVSAGRAEWVNSSMSEIRLRLDHPENVAFASDARDRAQKTGTGYDEICSKSDGACRGFQVYRGKSGGYEVLKSKRLLRG
jgi:hypothetical protein